MANAITSFLMLSAFMFPSAIQFFHVMEGHDHKVCTDSSEHFHESAPDCSAYHILQNTFHYHFISYPELGFVAFSSYVQEAIPPLVLDSYLHDNTQLRAPPVIS